MILVERRPEHTVPSINWSANITGIIITDSRVTAEGVKQPDNERSKDSTFCCLIDGAAVVGSLF